MLSVAYIDYYARQLTGEKFQGTTLWAACRVLKCKGVCTEELWPYDEYELVPDEQRLKELDEDAYQRRDMAYQRCYDIDDIKHAVYHLGPASTSFWIYPSFWDSYGDGKVEMPAPEERVVGLHAVVLTGWDDSTRRLRFMNSWGVKYGDNGYGTLPYDYLQEYSYETTVLIPRSKFINDSVWGFTDFAKTQGETVKITSVFGRGYTKTHSSLLVVELYDNQNKVSGWVIASPIREKVVEIIDFFVWPSKRNRGYGQLLLEAFLELQQTNNIREVFGWLSLDDTRLCGWEKATRFFTKRGLEYIKDPYTYPWSPGRIYLEL